VPAIAGAKQAFHQEISTGADIHQKNQGAGPFLNTQQLFFRINVVLSIGYCEEILTKFGSYLFFIIPFSHGKKKVQLTMAEYAFEKGK
jgi:hypothetical protein